MRGRRVLVFGASGAIGSALVARFAQQGALVFAVSRSGARADTACDPNVQWFAYDALAEGGASIPDTVSALDAVIWAQGANCNDDIYDIDLRRHAELYEANVVYILASLQQLLRQNKLSPRARLCVISSIWQNIARQRKLSYCVSKAALHGLVQSLAIDLGHTGLLVNAVLPGALDTPMTRANLDGRQIEALESMTPLGQLPTLDDVFGIVSFLCSEANTGITGQFISADRGFSYARIL
ncbi:MAG TPA: SDR family oxidoreductase [Rhodocyclaceae bacterium]|nr:SDR family oxidoreductase [Rhodocyclaceae bacterium]